jgi:hypothetical protein
MSLIESNSPRGIFPCPDKNFRRARVTQEMAKKGIAYTLSLEVSKYIAVPDQIYVAAVLNTCDAQQRTLFNPSIKSNASLYLFSNSSADI